ncbi:MAG: hypothetical protein IPH31_21330 [Lewinellaceae bacterium]|nr:hypothetical protein [Lewinellaceae bacterium]
MALRKGQGGWRLRLVCDGALIDGTEAAIRRGCDGDPLNTTDFTQKSLSTAWKIAGSRTTFATVLEKGSAYLFIDFERVTKTQQK